LEEYRSEEIVARFPYPATQIVSGADLRRLKENVEFDIAGVVVYVGGIERYNDKKKNILEYRWIKLLDNSSQNEEYAMKMYNNSQSKIVRKYDYQFCFIKIFF